ncbi:xylose isomerase [Lewinellaceae bacterium SD302]|nr:xylose isomerase [Lewinellaceae bacterium SD302]
MQRRTLLKNSAAFLVGSGLLPACAVKRKDLGGNKHPYGVQLFTIPKMVEADLPGTLALLGEIGYREVEFFGPYPFSAEATKKGWEAVKGMIGLSNNAFYGHTAEEVAAILNDYKLNVPSVHADLLSLRENAVGFARGIAPLKPTYIVVPAIDQPLRTKLDDYKRLADSFNKIGKQLSDFGMKFGYHNHGYEHLPMDGEVPLDYLIKNTNPEYVAFELDIFWMQAAGADPVTYLQKYPGRFKMLHLKDATRPFRFSGDGQTPDQWFAGFPLMADPGDGVYNIQAILAAAELSGVEHFYLERDVEPEPENTLRNSFGNLVGMK